MEVVFIALLVIALAVAFRLIAGAVDGTRIDDYVASRGGRTVEKHWHPFGRGWFGEQDSRIYAVRYRDADGSLHDATCKTSLFSGVYFTEDRIIARPGNAAGDREKRSLVEENKRLKAELERLRRQRD